MTVGVVALALDTGLDVGAARRLGDYEQLDDADLTSAFEQVRLQRTGRIAWPPHLRAVRGLAAVIDSGRAIRRLDVDADAGLDEATRLRRLFAAWPGAGAEAVAWRAADLQLLAARALMYDLPLPEGWCLDGFLGLADALGFPTAEAEPDTELECQQLFGVGAAAHCGPAARAEGRYRLWLRLQVARGRMSPEERHQREAAWPAEGAA